MASNGKKKKHVLRHVEYPITSEFLRSHKKHPQCYSALSSRSYWAFIIVWLACK